MSDDEIVPPLSEDLIKLVAANERGVRESTHGRAVLSSFPSKQLLPMKISELFCAQPKTAILIECIACVLFIGYVDYTR